MTLYVMLVGYEPFYGESEEELINANRETKVDFPHADWHTGELFQVSVTFLIYFKMATTNSSNQSITFNHYSICGRARLGRTNACD